MKQIILLIINSFYLIISQYSNDIYEQNKNIRFCGADLVNHEIKISSKIGKKHKLDPSRKLSTVFSPIRILLDTTNFEQEGNQIQSIKSKIPMLKEAMNKAVNALSDILEVEDYGNDIFTDLTLAFLNQCKISHWNPVLNNNRDIPADLIILTRFADVREFPDGVLASATPLLLYPLTNRPIVGLLTVSRSPSFYYYTNIKEYFSYVFLHELTHVLGFLEGIFPYFPQGIENILMKKEIRGKERTLVKSPKVVERARKYFNCDSLEGLELEDQGGTGSNISHWEQRILLGEYMGAVIYQEEMAISEFTLALLEDSGWYKAKYYTGGLFRFGKNKGCSFIQEDCLDAEYKSRFKNEFFDYDNLWYGSCSTGRQSRTYATLNNYLDFDNELYNRFDSTVHYNGGSIYTVDYCPINGQRYDETGNSYFFGNCKLGSPIFGTYNYYINPETNQRENGHFNSVLPKEIAEVLSENSFCIMTNLVPKGKEKYKIYNSIFHPMCYQTYCSSKSLTIQINNKYIVCPREGGNIKVEGYDGYLNCPDYNLICTGTVLCNDIFDCIEKRSLPKEDAFNYNYIPSYSIQNDDLLNYSPLEAYELSNDGKCSYKESQCDVKNKGFYYNKKIIIFPILVLITFTLL